MIKADAFPEDFFACTSSGTSGLLINEVMIGNVGDCGKISGEVFPAWSLFFWH